MSQNIRKEISHKIDREVAIPLLLIIEKYEYTNVFEREKMIELLTSIFGMSDFILHNPIDKMECLPIMLKSREKAETLFRVFTRGIRE